MDIFELIKTRRSIRKFQDKPIPKEMIEKIVEAGIRAPSSMNRQPWRFVVVGDPDAKKLLAEEAKSELKKFLQTDEAKKKWGDAVSRFMEHAESKEDTIFYNAPTVVFVILTKDLGNNNFDYGLATQNMLLYAHSLGIGSVPVGLAKPMNNSSVVRDKLNMKPEEKIIIGIPMGYPAETPPEKERNFDVVTWI